MRTSILTSLALLAGLQLVGQAWLLDRVWHTFSQSHGIALAVWSAWTAPQALLAAVWGADARRAWRRPRASAWGCVDPEPVPASERPTSASPSAAL